MGWDTCCRKVWKYKQFDAKHIWKLKSLYIYIPTSCLLWVYFPLLFLHAWGRSLDDWDFSSFLIYAFCTIKFPLCTTLTMSYQFWYVVFMFPVHFNIFEKFTLWLWIYLVTHGLIRSILFSIQVFEDFPVILLLFLVWVHCSWKTHAVWFQF